MSGEFEKRKDITNKIRTNISNISKDTFYVHKVGPGWMRLLSLRSFLLSPAEKLSTITNNTKGPWEYQHHRKQLQEHYDSKTIPVFLPAYCEVCWLLLPNCLFSIRRHSATTPISVSSMWQIRFENVKKRRNIYINH